MLPADEADEKEPVRRSLDGVDLKVYQRRASYPSRRVDKQGWYTGAETGRA